MSRPGRSEPEVCRPRGPGIRGALAIVVLLIAVATRATGAAGLDDARAHAARGEWAAAESLAAGALARLEGSSPVDSVAIARAAFLVAQSRWRGRTLADSIAIGAAGRSLEIRQRLARPDPLEVAATHALLAELLDETDRADSALTHARRALEIRVARLAPDDTLIADSHSQLAELVRQARDVHGAIEHWDRALAVYERVPGTERKRAEVLTSLATCWSRLDDPDRERALVRRALELLDSAFGPDEPARADPLNYLASIELNNGNPAPALDLFRRALRLSDRSQGEESRLSLTIRYNMQLCFQQLGEYLTAKQMCDAMLPAYERTFGPTSPRTLTIRQGRAFANQRLGKDAEALQEYREVVAIYEQRPGPSSPNLALAWRDMANIFRQQGRFDEALAVCRHAIEKERSSPRPIGAGLLTLQFMLVSILEAKGDRAALDSAASELPGIAEKYRLGSLLDHANVEHWVSRAHQACGRPDSAWAHALESDRWSLQRLRLNLESSPDRRALQFARRTQLYLDLVLDLAAGAPERIETAWDRLVRTRGQVAAEMARRRPPAELRSDSALVGAHARWIQAQRRYSQKLVQAPPRDSAGRARMDEIRARTEDAEHEYATLLDRHGAGLPAADPGLAEVRGRLGADAALVTLVEPHEGGDTARVTAYVARRDGPVRAVELGRSSALGAALTPWLERLGTPPGTSAQARAEAETRCRELGRAVRALTWDRIAPLVAGSREVFLVPDGPLVDLPWNALPDGASGYLVEASPRIHRLNAERELIHEPRISKSGTLLAVGAPDYSRPLPASGASEAPLAAWLRSADPCATEAFGPLPGTAAEARAIAKAWESSGFKARLLLGPDASEAEFKREASHRAVLHLATHGFVLRDSCAAAASGTRGVGGVEPLAAARKSPSVETAASTKAPSTAPPKPAEGQRVWLAFAGANRAREHHGDENEGLLTAEEVVTLDLDDTEWVVLSACHSGIAEGWYREGSRGMRDAFHFAGARSVIASQWAVEDDATREWMTALYTARATGRTGAAEALTEASRQVISERRRTGRSTHPFYWAAFSASGE